VPLFGAVPHGVSLQTGGRSAGRGTLARGGGRGPATASGRMPHGAGSVRRSSIASGLHLRDFFHGSTGAGKAGVVAWPRK
jgi:hypothetical protein